MTEEGEILRPIKTLASDAQICLQLWEDVKGNMLVSSTGRKPKGTVYFATTPSQLCRFLENKISLQTLFRASPSFIVEIVSNTKAALYSTRDVEIELERGEQKAKQLMGTSPWEIWQGCNN